jgi:hypothetical protein
LTLAGEYPKADASDHNLFGKGIAKAVRRAYTITKWIEFTRK